MVMNNLERSYLVFVLANFDFRQSKIVFRGYSLTFLTGEAPCH